MDGVPSQVMKFQVFAKKPMVVALVGAMVGSFVRLVRGTSSVVFFPGDFHSEIAAYQPFILAMWHGQFMMLAALNKPGWKVAAIVSRHADGELIAATLKRFNIDLIRGAGAGRRKRDRGGTFAFRAALSALERGSIVAMTADIPTDEPRTVGPGIVMLARLSGRPIIPVAAAGSRFVALNTWSRMTINLPFSRLAFVAGQPLFVPENADARTLDELRRNVQRSLEKVTSRAYALAGGEWPMPTVRAVPLGHYDETGSRAGDRNLQMAGNQGSPRHTSLKPSS